MNSTPKSIAICRATSVLPTPVGPVNKNEPIGCPGVPSPARERLIDVTIDLMAGSCPKTTSLSRSPRVSNLVLSDVETLRVGMRAILATIFSISDGCILVRRGEPDKRI